MYVKIYGSWIVSFLEVSDKVIHLSSCTFEFEESCSELNTHFISGQFLSLLSSKVIEILFDVDMSYGEGVSFKTLYVMKIRSWICVIQIPEDLEKKLKEMTALEKKIPKL